MATTKELKTHKLAGNSKNNLVILSQLGLLDHNIGGHAIIREAEIFFHGEILKPDGSIVHKDVWSGPISDSKMIGEAAGQILKEKGEFSTIRKIFAPIWIKGPIEKFVDGKTVIVGDSAGQAKPTTAGGIYTSGMGGIYAGQAISKFLKTNEISHLQEYQKRWTVRFGKEFDKQLLARKLLERIDNQTINKLFESITPEITNEISEKDDFDFHTSSIIKLLGIKGSLKTAQTLISGEFKKILG